MLSKLFRSAMDLVFPIHCAGCGREGGIICGQCAEGPERLTFPYCRICAAPDVSGLCRWCRQRPRGFDSLRSPYRFDGAVREAIHSFKYRGVRAAAPDLAMLMAEYLQRNPIPADALVPAPLHPRRLRSRGYNQSALLARGIGRIANLPVREDLLIRVADARPQVEAKTREERHNNVAGSFACRGDVTGLTLLLVDDVATTGSTLSECAQALKGAGAAAVNALTLARDG